ncbi:KTSC domain-containing protein [Cochlodiniinecator piscidefendens]|uniref:KTSC domain-containing protein n=1 Tax=Cochlodiniinecator piscidefendens TaxID=2715756 RepID=UPI001407EB5F|nr:KTSC domain-containing protein [Cochlodiniinecator piscidefendens]
MEMISVSSSNVSAVGYDSDTSTLQIQFNDGSLYQYFDVPEHIFDGLRTADSAGRYLHQNVKGVFRYSRV